MPRFWAYTRITQPGLHIWREGTDLKLYLQPTLAADQAGWTQFEYNVEPGITEKLRFMLFAFADDGSLGSFENDAHQRVLPQTAEGTFPSDVWFAEGTARVLTQDPRQASLDHLRLRLISQSRFRPGQAFLWDAVGGTERRIDQSGADHLGPFFDVDLRGQERAFIQFKFIGRDDAGNFTRFEAENANRLWTAADGAEVWTHSGTAELASTEPQKRTLRVHYQQAFPGTAQMRLWATNGDYQTDIQPAATVNGWTAYQTDLYTNLPYGFLFWNPDLPRAERWEHSEAKREPIEITSDTEFWTLEGDRALFDIQPQRDRAIDLTIAVRSAGLPPGRPLFAHVWVNRARGPIQTDVAVGVDDRVTITTYPRIVTSLKFHDGAGNWESIARHTLRDDDAAPLPPAGRYVVLNRPPLLASPPSDDLYCDPPFTIRRPGAYEQAGFVRFALHAPDAARVRLIGQWTAWDQNPVEMQLTHDGTYWWAQIERDQLLAGLEDAAQGYHGAGYQFIFDDETRMQDPAAGWVESSWNQAASRLVQSDRFQWHDQDWQRPGWEYLVVYQLHAGRFTNRYPDEPPLQRIAREIEDQAGYLHDLGVTAIQLLPLNEVGTKDSWGYDPAFFYAIENAYCGDQGPDALKLLVDTCHRHGLAVLIDVVFNHAGDMDNILWRVARESFFDGDTRWGAMVNFDHPQCRHFFAQNLVYLAQEFHIDGFRLDHTATIVHSAAWDAWSTYVRERGSGGGWDFLHSLRHAIETQVGPRCILVAEHLPNEWSLTNRGGPMDSQWCDDYHDRLVDACRRQFGIMPRLAEALKLSHTACDDWYKVTNYPESHDEVGNVRDRVAYVAGWGQGLRMSKVAAAASLLSRGIPMFFMGAESAEDQQFRFGGADALDLQRYRSDPDRSRVRAWWRQLCLLHHSPSIKGPAPLEVRYADGQILAFSRGARSDFFVLLNFGGWSGRDRSDRWNLPHGSYRELWNSTWPAFAVHSEQEDEHTNGGRGAQLRRSDQLNVPDYGVLILERFDD